MALGFKDDPKFKAAQNSTVPLSKEDKTQPNLRAKTKAKSTCTDSTPKAKAKTSARGRGRGRNGN